MPSIGQTWVLASIGAVIEMGVLSTLKRLLKESSKRDDWFSCVGTIGPQGCGGGNDRQRTKASFFMMSLPVTNWNLQKDIFYDLDVFLAKTIIAEMYCWIKDVALLIHGLEG
jgi:hypothetical protein